VYFWGELSVDLLEVRSQGRRESLDLDIFGANEPFLDDGFEGR